MDKLNDEALVRMQTLEDADTIKKNISELINYCVKKENIVLNLCIIIFSFFVKGEVSFALYFL